MQQGVEKAFFQSPTLQEQKWTEDSAEQFHKTGENALTVLKSRLEELAASKGQINELLAKMQQYLEVQCLRETGTAVSHTERGPDVLSVVASGREMDCLISSTKL